MQTGKQTCGRVGGWARRRARRRSRIILPAICKDVFARGRKVGPACTCHPRAILDRDPQHDRLAPLVMDVLGIWPAGCRSCAGFDDALIAQSWFVRRQTCRGRAHRDIFSNPSRSVHVWGPPKRRPHRQSILSGASGEGECLMPASVVMCWPSVRPSMA